MGRRRGSMLVLLALGCAAGPPAGDGFALLERFASGAARQGVAVGADHFFAIGTRRIEKLERATGRRVAAWDAGDDARIGTPG